MKKLFFTGLFLLLLQASGFSQRFYVRIGGGYTWPSGSQHMASHYRVNYNAATNAFTESYAYKQGSYGAGQTGSLALGYKFSDQLGVEGSFSYLAGKTYQSGEQYSGSFTGNMAAETYARMPALFAGLVISPSGRQWRPYAKAGIMVGQPRIFNQDQTSFNNDVIQREWEIIGKKAWGFQGALGLQYGLSPRWGLFLEGLFRTMSFVPEKAQITSYVKNGENQYTALTVQQRELEYKASYSQSSNNQGADERPSQTSNTPFAFGAAGLQLGLQLNLR